MIITDFLVDRATHELLTSFLEGLLTKDKSSSDAILMPAMAATIGNLDDYEVSALIPMLRSAAIEDVRDLMVTSSFTAKVKHLRRSMVSLYLSAILNYTVSI